MFNSSVSIIIPTYREVKNLPLLIARLANVRQQLELMDAYNLELLIVDDDSDDGTEAYIDSLNQSWMRLFVRKQERGLSSAVVKGLILARHEFLVVMDADLSHPPEKIPAMLDILQAGADFVIGSRYVAGGTTSADWSVWRRLNSKIATLLAYPLTTAKDPLSGFFALHRATWLRGQTQLNPIGYKIGLELIVKCHCQKIQEIPIDFVDREQGQSKLTWRQQWQYLQHLWRLYHTH